MIIVHVILIVSAVELFAYLVNPAPKTRNDTTKAAVFIVLAILCFLKILVGE